MKWTIAKARERLSELVRKAAHKPQPIFNRDKLVAAVIGAETYQEFQAWREKTERRTLADAFTELRTILAEERYSLTIPKRQDRPDTFAETLNELPR